MSIFKPKVSSQTYLALSIFCNLHVIFPLPKNYPCNIEGKNRNKKISFHFLITFKQILGLIMNDEIMELVTTILEIMDQEPVTIMILIIEMTVLTIETRTFIIDLNMDSLVIEIMATLDIIDHHTTGWHSFTV